MRPDLFLSITVLLLAVLGCTLQDPRASKDSPGNTSEKPENSRPGKVLVPNQDQDQQAEIKERIDDLEKKLNEQENPPGESKTPPKLAAGRARVNSPDDGFLALRTMPSINEGERIGKIPHGATVKILYSDSQATIVEGRRGHWIQVSYGGDVGWVFDAYLIR